MYQQEKIHILGHWMQHSLPWLLFVVYLLITWFAAWLTRWVVRQIVRRLTQRYNVALSDRLIKIAVGPARLVVWTVGLQFSLDALYTRIPSLQTASEYVWVDRGVSALVVLAVTATLNALMRGALDWYVETRADGDHALWDRELVPVVRRVFSIVLYFIAISMILRNFGKDITALVTTAGVASLAVALAAQETLSNMLGGLVILVDRPFRVGDIIELSDGKGGEVREIGLRSTHIVQFDGNTLVIPNKDMANSRIINLALPTHRAAIRMTLGVDYGTNLDRAKQVLLQVMEAHPDVLRDPAPGVWFTKFNESSLDLFLSCWVDSYKDRFRVTDELNMQILKALRAAKIEIPFPQRGLSVTLRNGPDGGNSSADREA